MFVIEGKFWHVVDVAGQKDKRAKWVQYFDREIESLLYVFSVVSYCQTMEESPMTNRLVDAIELYESLMKNPLLKPMSVVILFNKNDLLAEKFKSHPPKNYFPDFKGETELDFLNFVRDKMKVVKKSNCTFFFHRTAATDKTLMQKVVGDIM